jgi:8-amino-7-oxononanoate synthase
MDSLRSLDGYVHKRLHLAGGSLFEDESADADPVDMLKSIYLRPLDALRREHEESGKPLVSFANYDYAGLANDARVKRAACDAVMAIGIGSGASRLVGGQREIHAALERDLAAFLGAQDSIVLVSGYMTNVSLVGHLLTKNDLIVVDELAHSSIIIGTAASRARVIRFAHNDLRQLESILAKHRSEASRALIIVEGLYSMDGDIVDLPHLLEIKNRHGAWLMVDEAHSLGVLGATGRGVAEHFGIDPSEIELIVGTMSKTLGASGGYIAGRRSVINWLRFTLPAFVFSVGLSPVLAAAIREALTILRAEPWRVTRLRENSSLFISQAKERRLDTGRAIGAGVVPVLFSTARDCMTASRGLLEAGYYAPPILQMAVPKDRPRIRFFISALHTDSQIAGACETLGSLVETMRSAASRASRHWMSRRSRNLLSSDPLRL